MVINAGVSEPRCSAFLRKTLPSLILPKLAANMFATPHSVFRCARCGKEMLIAENCLVE